MNNISFSSAVCLILVILPAITSASEGQTDAQAERHFEKANELLKLAEYDAAIAEYNEVINLSSDSRITQNARYWIGQSHFKAGRFDVAEETFAKLIEEHPASAIVPATQIVLAQVQQEKENQRLRAKSDIASDKGVIIDPESGLRFTKVLGDEKLDVIEDPIWMTVSPDGRFLFTPFGRWVVPLEEGTPFKLDEPRVAEMAGPNLFPSWSPDGTMISFRSEGALWIIPVSLETKRANGPARKLADGLTRMSTWSPDAKMIAYAGNGDIWKISTTGGAPQQITDSPMPECFPAWSPDGSQIAFVRDRDKETKGRDIWLISPQGRDARKIVENGGYPRWSGDGKYILFLRKDKGTKLWIYQISSKLEYKIELPGDWRVFSYFYWTKDNRLLFLDAGTSYRSALKVVSVYGGPSMDLSKDIDGEVYPYYQSWSPDSKWIITAGPKTKFGETVEGTSIWMVSTAGKQAIPIHLEHVTSEQFYYPNATWSPDGSKLAYLSKSRNLWIVPFSSETGQPEGPPTKIADDVGDAMSWSPDSRNWSPDARKIAFTTSKSGNVDIWIGSVADGKTVRLTDGAEDEMNPQWSPDGEKIAYVVKEKGFWVIPAIGGEPKQIATEAFFDGETCSWSPDALKIAVADKAHISIIDVVSGEVKHIVDTEKLGVRNIFCVRWSPDGRNIAFLSTGSPPFHLWVAPATGGVPMNLAIDDTGGKYWLYWSPDGKRISFNSDATVKLHTASIWEADLEQILKSASR